MPREMIRQGGRSARIQREVHAATRTLLEKMDRGSITVPMIAEAAGVTPSTIYRRWGDLGQVFADVAIERLRPVSEPDDTGSTEGDLEAFVLQYAEEMSSPVGRSMLRDILSDAENDVAAATCCQYTITHLETITARSRQRGEPGFAVGDVIDSIIAPICYHILFGDRDVSPAYCGSLLLNARGLHYRNAA